MKTKKSNGRKSKMEKYIDKLKKIMIKEIQMLPDNVFKEELDFANALNDEIRMEEFAKTHAKEITWVMGQIDVEKVIKEARNQLALETKKNKTKK
ncbi:MAG: hypothetical protein NT068_01065 [Candidatus Nomurabacteria bacterium]|nr:hypothetical protein [Candidatus Nomurabacteria bacterium]